MNLENCINLHDLQRAAKRRLPKVVYDFIEGGVDDEDALTRNENAFKARPLMPRYMVDVRERDQSVTLFGRQYASPFGIGPTGGIGNFRRGGDLMLAAAARDADVPFIMSGAATASMEDLAKIAPNHGWYQVYVANNRSISEDMIRRASDCGFSTLVLTVDVPYGVNRERNRRNGFGRPLRLSMASKINALKYPAWLTDYLRHGIANLPNWAPYAPEHATPFEVGEFVATQMPSPVVWNDVERFRELWAGNLVLKGVMRTDDAYRARDLGVDGLIVSNHGARQLDRAPSALDVMPGIKYAVGDKMTIMMDGGVRRGADALIALCLGAEFVFLGRPTLYGVVAGGQAGATRALDILRGEVSSVMAQIGCTSLDQLGPDFVEFDPDALQRNRQD
ncbi:MAG: alpha-hydroxy-acid oxidizing protein [Chromatiales bacterium]|nr:alpha-hydroxy-acid oxidizing protein [Chromatiales bacterium]